MRSWSGWRRLLILALVLLAEPIPPLAAAAVSPAQLFVEGIATYKKGDYDTAVARFQALVDAGHSSGELYYNLGNACFKADRLGHAIWWYERAKRLMPGDPDLKFNLNHARSRIQDQPETAALPLTRVLFFWRYQLPGDQIQWLALGFNLVFWAALMVRRVMGRRAYRSWLLVLALPALLFTATAAYNRYEARYHQEAIVLPPQISVRAGHTPGATELFVLHAGTKVGVQTRQGDHLRIRFGRDKIGWVAATELGII
jgi:tetratricopeptide (TPR) repeat protein